MDGRRPLNASDGRCGADLREGVSDVPGLVRCRRRSTAPVRA